MIDLRALPRISGRWTASDKMNIVLAVRRGEISFARACARFDLSSDELQAWINGYQRNGLKGLTLRARQQVRA